MDDHDLMRRLAGGDETALAALLERHWARLVRYAFRLLGRWDAAEDAAQHAFVRLWAERRRWRGGAPSALLHRIARNAALDVLRSPRTRSVRVEAEELIDSARPDSDAEADELAEAAAAAIDALPSRRREIFLLARESGLGYAEIAEVTGLARQTVANQMSLALRDLRASLRPYLSGTFADRVSDRPARKEVSHDG